jgi:hypothetical protein
MRKLLFLSLLIVSTCGPAQNAKLPGTASPGGGATGGSTPGTGGATGGNRSAGDQAGKGGSAGGTGGGSTNPFGGSTTGGSGGKAGTGGSGGKAGSGGSGGSAGSAGSAGSGGSGTTYTPSNDPNCVKNMIGAGYACGTAKSCAECKVNGQSLEDKCKNMVNCVQSKWPCDTTSGCWLECRNSVGGDSVLDACAQSLVKAACSAGATCGGSSTGGSSGTGDAAATDAADAGT